MGREANDRGGDEAALATVGVFLPMRSRFGTYRRQEASQAPRRA